MDGNTDSEWSDEFDWDSGDEIKTQNPETSSCSCLEIPHRNSLACTEKASTSACSSRFNLIPSFVEMGFSESMVAKAIAENGEESTEAILETLFTYSVLEKSSPECKLVHLDSCSSESGRDIDKLSDADSRPGNQANTEHLSDKDKKISLLLDMGFPLNEASSAIDTCGLDTSVAELMDFICAAQMEKEADAHLRELPHPISDDDELSTSHLHGDPLAQKKRKSFKDVERWERKLDSWKKRQAESVKRRKKVLVYDDTETVHVPKLMMGFGVPSEPSAMFNRTVPHSAVGPPYFYYENVAFTPKGVWNTMSRFLYDIEPEFVDSIYFCAAARKRGYIHNLPLQNRFPLVPIPPLTIQEAFPLTKKWWPSWDKRTKLNCLQTCTGSAKLTERILKALEGWNEEPPLKNQKFVLYQCKKWNLIWVGKNKAAPLEPDEMEMLLGYPKNHTRGGGTSRTERFKALGNAFQVDTVAYHLSVLKNMFPNGVSVLSLFSGIGGAEVALHRLGIALKNVVSVEISEINRNILQSWWEQSNQRGNLIHIEDVQKLGGDRLEQLINSFGGFDLVIGGSPCNNLTGSNRVTRDGLEGKDSVLFYEYFRILDIVKCIMGKGI